MTSRMGGTTSSMVGAGHNGLVSAAYLARAGTARAGPRAADAGRRRGGHVAAVRRPARAVLALRVPGLADAGPADHSRTSSSTSRLAPRPMASYTPVPPRRPAPRPARRAARRARATRNSFLELTGGGREYDAWCSSTARSAAMARAVGPTLLQPLPLGEGPGRARGPEATWREFVTTPLGEVIEQRFADDTVRGIVASRRAAWGRSRSHARRRRWCRTAASSTG